MHYIADELQSEMFDKLITIANGDIDLVQEAIWKTNPGPIMQRRFFGLGRKQLIERPSKLEDIIDYILRFNKSVVD